MFELLATSTKKKTTQEKGIEEKGIDIYYNSRDQRFFSSGLRNQVKQNEDK
tara:strand:+ start:214 stop:366 length:153 start_codon:yes stop_codon:yes gene_type:complete